jgi:hypothetical protein
MVLKGQKMKIISAFTSNCLVQCAVFLVNIRIKLVESGDTAKQLAELGTTTRIGAVAAQLPQNYTIWKFCRRNSHGTK